MSTDIKCRHGISLAEHCDECTKVWFNYCIAHMKRDLARKLHKRDVLEGTGFPCDRPGFEKLWTQFGLDRASWLTLPRSMMHQMPDDWQYLMAELLEEWDQTWDTTGQAESVIVSLQARVNGRLKFIKVPEFISNYRRSVDLSFLKRKQ